MTLELGLADITDSTDWLSTEIPAFAPLEASLRCEICKDFYKTPMVTECDHTFCSLCIRRILDDTSKCPLCLTTTQQVKLRKCIALENTLEIFTKARADLIKFCKNKLPSQPPPIIPSQWESQTSPGSKRSHSQTGTSSPVAAESSRRSKRLRSSNRLVTYAEKVVDDDADDADELNAQPDKQNTEYREKLEIMNDGLVACPICSKRMKEVLVSNHLDTTCGQDSSSPPRQPASSVLPSRINPFLRQQPPLSRPLDRLPALNYSLLKDAALRKKMAELGISTSGSRLLLEKRHREWTTLWNANCDSARPKRKVELLRDLEQWERTIANPKPGLVARGYSVDIKDKEFNGAAWATKHESSFQDLIASARRSRQQTQNNSKPAEKSEPIVVDLSNDTLDNRVIPETPPADELIPVQNEIPSSSQMTNS